MEKGYKYEVLKGKIELRTGLHIGGVASTKIGGIDSPVIKTHEGLPYIPGSSLKGKLRSIMYNLNNGESEDLLDIFGRSGDKNENVLNLGTLIVRDSFVNEEETRKNLGLEDDSRSLVELKDELFEEKVENMIDKEKGIARAPRFIERVKKGVVFDFELILRNVGNRDIGKHKEILEKLFKNLEESDYLGGSGTRGYGYVKIKFE